ncbi:MAG: hypothetical protein LC687_04105 [Actinobacteria bacterium]|nr:hypothetical protein [Actinomycetota bacterium]MCA1807018.1 hypothetical protein [Actinomycetota bacterium]
MMNTKQVTFDRELKFDVDLSALNSFSGFLGSWIDRTAPSLQDRAIMFDFAKGKMHISKSQSVTGGPIGTFILPFLPWHGDEFPEDVIPVRLMVPLHKVISVVTWTNRTSGDVGRGTLRLTKDGKVYMIGGNNTIQMEATWAEASENDHTIFEAYAGSLVHRLDEVYEDMPSTAATQLRKDTLAFKRSELPYPFSSILYRDVEVGKIDSSLTYIPTNSIPNQGKFHVLEYDEESEEMKEVDSDIHGQDSATTLISYSRMSLFFSPLPKHETFSGNHIVSAYDSSVPLSFLSSVAALLKELEKRVDDTFSVSLSTYHFPADDSTGFSVLGIRAAHPDNLDNVYTVILTIPSTTDAGGMAPPSKEDVASIVPEVDASNCMHFTVPYGELRDTLAFWDTLQKADGANIVTPLKPISLSIDAEEGTFKVEMASETSHNEAVFNMVGQGRYSGAQEIQVPFDPLMKVLNSKLFQEGENKPYITFIRRDTEDAAELLLSRNGCVAIIAEFI